MELELEELDKSIVNHPYQSIMEWGEQRLKNVGRKVFSILALMPVSLIAPDMPYQDKFIRSNMHTLVLGGSGSSKSTLVNETFGEITYKPISFNDISKAEFVEEMFGIGDDVSVLSPDVDRIFKNPALIKILEGITGEEKCCFEDTFVQMGNGDIKKIKEVEIGDELTSFNSNLEFENAKVINKHKTITNNYIKIKTRTSSLTVTPQHKFFILQGKEFVSIEAKYLKKGDFIPIPLQLNFPSLEYSLPNVEENEIVIITEQGRQLIKEKVKEFGLTYHEVSKKLGKSLGYTSQMLNNKKFVPHKSKKLIKYLLNIFKVDEKLYDQNYFKIPINIPKSITVPLCEFLGAYWGDGNYDDTNHTLYMSDKDIGNLNYYNDLIKTIFNAKTEIKQYGHKYKLYIKQTLPLFNLMKKLGLTTSNNRNLPKLVYHSSNDELSAFVRGYFDAETSVRTSNTGGSITLETSCEEVTHQLRLLLLRFGVLCKIGQRKRFEKRTTRGEYNIYSLTINDRKSLVNYHKKIGYNHPQKIEKLEFLISKFKKGHLKYYRYPSTIIKELMKLLKIKPYNITKELNKRVNEIISGEYNVPSKLFRMLVPYFNEKFEELKSKGINIDKIEPYINLLNQLLNKENEFGFDEIIGIEIIENGNELVFYDLTLDKNYNFIAEGLFTHNSINSRNMRRQRNFSINAIFLGAGLPESITKYAAYGMLRRLTPIIMFHTTEEKDEIHKHIRNSMFSSTPSIVSVEQIKKFYLKLWNIQKGKDNEFERVDGYIVEDTFKEGIYYKHKELSLLFPDDKYLITELQSGFRYMCNHAILNFFNRKKEKGKIVIEREDYEKALNLLDLEMRMKAKIFRSHKIVNATADILGLYNDILNDDRLDITYKNIAKILLEEKMGKKLRE